MPGLVELHPAYEAIHKTLTEQRKQATRITTEHFVLIARSRRALDDSQALHRETEHLVRVLRPSGKIGK